MSVTIFYEYLFRKEKKATKALMKEREELEKERDELEEKKRILFEQLPDEEKDKFREELKRIGEMEENEE